MLLPSLEMGGMERMVSDLSVGLLGHSVKVRVVCTHTEGVLAAALSDRGVKVTLLPVRGKRTFLGDPALIAEIREFDPTVVHTHSGFWWRGVIAARLARVPRLVHTVHGLQDSEPWWGPTEKRLAASITDKVVGVSSALSAYLVGVCGVHARKVVTLANGVDLSLFGHAEPLPLSYQFGFAPEAFVFGTLARLAPVKNLDLAVRALSQLVGHGIDAHFVIAGDGPERARLESLAAAAGLAARVHFLGEVSEPNRFLAALDAFTLTSHAEGTSISLLEAMSSRLPCVVTAVGGNPEVVADGEAGLLVPDNDATALAEALRLLACDTGKRVAIGRIARSRVQEAYSLESMVAAYLNLYSGEAPETI